MSPYLDPKQRPFELNTTHESRRASYFYLWFYFLDVAQSYRRFTETMRSLLTHLTRRADVLDRIERGLHEAGWNPVAGPTGNVIATEMRRFRQWGLYSVEVELEVAPVGGEYVRLLVHPFRIYFTGAKSKVPYLRGSLARAVFKGFTRYVRNRRALVYWHRSVP